LTGESERASARQFGASKKGEQKPIDNSSEKANKDPKAIPAKGTQHGKHL
jgi:hypothetical protein